MCCSVDVCSNPVSESYHNDVSRRGCTLTHCSASLKHIATFRRGAKELHTNALQRVSEVHCNLVKKSCWVFFFGVLNSMSLQKIIIITKLIN